MLDMLIEQLKALIEADELFDLGAKMIAKSVEALEKNGFSREEAIRITASQGSFVKGSN